VPSIVDIRRFILMQIRAKRLVLYFAGTVEAGASAAPEPEPEPEPEPTRVIATISTTVQGG